MNDSKMRFWIVATMGLIAILALRSSSTALVPITVEWSRGAVGGGWYTMAAGISEIVKVQVPEITIKVVPGGGVINPARVGEAKTLMAWGLPPIVINALKGIEPYDKMYPDIRSIGGTFSDNHVHWVAAKDTGAKSIQELIDKKAPIRIAVSPVGSVDEFSLRKILEIYGVTYKDMRSWGGKVFFAGYSNASSLLKDRHVDFAASIIAPPAAYLLDAKMGRPLRLLTFSEEVLDRLENEYGYSRGAISKDVYPDMVDQDLMSPVMGTVAICHKSIPEDVVYAITKALCATSL